MSGHILQRGLPLEGREREVGSVRGSRTFLSEIVGMS
jgi:hypothetical protein